MDGTDGTDRTDGTDGVDGMVLIGHRFSKSTFGANKCYFACKLDRFQFCWSRSLICMQMIMVISVAQKENTATLRRNRSQPPDLLDKGLNVQNH